jgi:penicillin-binding protein 1B
VRVTALLIGVPFLAGLVVAGYYYATFARLIDAQLHGERTRVLPQIFARPLELRVGQSMTPPQLVDRLNDLGYTERATIDRAGEFSMTADEIIIAPRPADLKGQPVKVHFRKPVPPAARNARRPPPKPAAIERVEALELGAKSASRVTLDAPLLSALESDRSKRRPVALSAIPPQMVNAVLAIEDRRYYYHPGVDPIRLTGAVLQGLTSGKRISATSTVTQQLIRNVFLPKLDGWSLESAREREGVQGKARKAFEIFLAFVLDRRATKDEVLEMYLNALPLGQRGSFAIIGVPEAARLFFGKDVTNLTLPEAATIAGVIQSPSALSPFNNPKRCVERRNVVIRAMQDAEFITKDAADEAVEAPLTVVQRALEAEAPYFVDYVRQTIAEDYPTLTTTDTTPVAVFTTLDLHLQRLAQDAVRSGLTNVDKLLARRKKKGRAEAALVAVDPRTGEIVAMVGGRSYNQSQYNRAVVARRQPGSVFKPFVYLAAFEGASQGLNELTPASIEDDAPTTWEFDDQVWTPRNFEDEYKGPISLRYALAHSKNIVAVKVAEKAGYDRVADLWKRLRVGTVPKPYPSIALGVFEATPLEIASAYTIFPNLGIERPLQHIMRIDSGSLDVTKKRSGEPLQIAQPNTTYLVTSLMRSVINNGTGAGARGQGFVLDAAGKTGTTNDLRDAWFVGFTPELLTVVWVGFDDNQPVGLQGASAALPIWTQFMKTALAGRPNVAFDVPEGITYADVDPATGQLAGPKCPDTQTEVFASGTEPTAMCLLHQF